MPEDFVAEQLKSVLSDMRVDVVRRLHVKALVIKLILCSLAKKMLRDNSIVKCYLSLVDHLRTILCSQYNYLYVTFYPRYFDFFILVLPFVSLSFFFFFCLFFFFHMECCYI